MPARKEKYMTVSELSFEQMEELKQNYLINHLLEVEDRSASYEEIASAAEIVPDNIIFDIYDGTIFCNDDFACTAEIPLF